ncbi:IS200/IS605 family transposase [Clostridioides sp. ZZV15-6383]|uniref:IS200/IS605 family transposase n=1 Tax=unclassified Clostridioides TaxID=2635829 RepID=UPI000D1DF67E|nr:IS200/IS605 family transposase [Clostridioides sp. ZZV14-6345]MCC0698858.1 IS200/IS605 family transposase [Clostridioides sp. ZZV15-6383]
MYKSNGNITYDCKYHIIFCPKYRKPVLVGEVKNMLKEIMPYKADELGAEIIEMEINKDHVHLLILCDPQFGIHKVVKGLKGFSSRILRENFQHLKSSMPSMWTNSYFVGTVGTVSLEVVKQYINNQPFRSKKK